MQIAPATISPQNTLTGITEGFRNQVRNENAGLVERVMQTGQQEIMEIYNVAHSHRMDKPGPRFFSAQGKPPQNLTFITGKHVDVRV